MIRFLTMEKYHNKRGVGSTKLRVHNLIKYWPEADLYKYGENPDVLIFQKVYCTEDYKYPTHFKKLKILDICDPDWMEAALVKETIDGMDAVVVPTEPMQQFLKQLTDKPVVVIKDRFDLADFPPVMNHYRDTKRLVWFGYVQNAELLRYAMLTLERLGLNLTVISNDDPHAYRWAASPEGYKSRYIFKKYDDKTIYKELQHHDICILPEGDRPQDRFKSENKTVMAQLLGLPVVRNIEELEEMSTPEARNKHIQSIYAKLRDEYDCKRSVDEYKSLIQQLKHIE